MSCLALCITRSGPDYLEAFQTYLAWMAVSQSVHHVGMCFQCADTTHLM